MTPEELRVKALELAIKASTDYRSHRLGLWTYELVETAEVAVDRLLQGTGISRITPHPGRVHRTRPRVPHLLYPVPMHDPARGR